MDTIKKKKIKKIIVAVVIIAVILGGVFAVSSHKIEIMYRIVYSIIPDHIDATINDEIPLTVYKRLNPDYDPQKDDEINFMEFYYYDVNGKEVVIAANDSFIYDGVNNGSPFAAFLFEAKDTIAKIRTIAVSVGVVIAIAVIVALIIFWFFKWSKKQDDEKEKKYGNNQKHKSKKKK